MRNPFAILELCQLSGANDPSPWIRSKATTLCGMFMKSQRGTEYRNDRHACRHKLSSKPAAAVVADLPMGTGSRRECVQDVQKFAVHNNTCRSPGAKGKVTRLWGNVWRGNHPYLEHTDTLSISRTRELNNQRSSSRIRASVLLGCGGLAGGIRREAGEWCGGSG